MKLRRFKVRGPGRLPVDMLRYDCCWPDTGEDAALIEAKADPLASREERQRVQGKVQERGITLASYSEHAPCVGRWESFGWSVEALR